MSGAAAEGTVAVKIVVDGVDQVNRGVSSVAKNAAGASRGLAGMGGSGADAARKLALVGDAGEAAGRRGALAFRQFSSGLATIADQGAVATGALKPMLGAVGELAFSFGMTGPIVGGLALVGLAIYNTFDRARQEIQKTKEVADETFRSLGRGGDLVTTARTANRLRTGDAFATAKDFGEGKTAEERAEIARTGGLAGLQKRLAEAESRRKTLGLEIAAQKAKGGFDAAERLYQGNLALAKDMDVRIAKMRAALPGIQDELKRLDALSRDQAGKMNTVLGLEAAQKQADAIAEVDKQWKEMDDAQRRSEANARRRGLDLTPRLPAFTMARDGAAGKFSRGNPTDFKSVVNAIGNPEVVKTTFQEKFGQIKFPEIHLPGLTWTQQQQQDMLAKSLEMGKKLGDSIAQGIGSTIGTSLSAAIQAAFAPGADVGSVFKALAASVLSGIGQMFQQIGEGALAGLIAMKLIKESIANFNPEMGIAKALSLIAIGAALQGAGGLFNSGGGGGDGSRYVSPAYSAHSGTTYGGGGARGVVGSDVTPRQSLVVNATFLSPNDPTFQRQLVETITKAQKRMG